LVMDWTKASESYPLSAMIKSVRKPAINSSWTN